MKVKLEVEADLPHGVYCGYCRHCVETSDERLKAYTLFDELLCVDRGNGKVVKCAKCREQVLPGAGRQA